MNLLSGNKPLPSATKTEQIHKISHISVYWIQIFMILYQSWFIIKKKNMAAAGIPGGAEDEIFWASTG